MRISDWSSDVCSSDLIELDTADQRLTGYSWAWTSWSSRFQRPSMYQPPRLALTVSAESSASTSRPFFRLQLTCARSVLRRMPCARMKASPNALGKVLNGLIDSGPPLQTHASTHSHPPVRSDIG